MDVLIDAGGQVHRLPELTARLVIENLRLPDFHEDELRAIADRLELFADGDDPTPIVFDEDDHPHLAKAIDVLLAGPHASPDLEALFWALNGGTGPPRS